MFDISFMCSSVVYHGVSLGERGGGQPNDRKQSRTDRNRTEKKPGNPRRTDLNRPVRCRRTARRIHRGCGRDLRKKEQALLRVTAVPHMAPFFVDLMSLPCKKCCSLLDKSEFFLYTVR